MNEEKKPEKYSPCEVMLAFGDGDYLFRLPLKQISELEEKSKAGIGAIFARVLQGRIMLKENGEMIGLPTHAGYFLSDIRETIRLGLIGGGAKPVEVSKLMERYVDGTPLRDQWNLAAAILAATIEGYTGKPKTVEGDKPVGEAPATAEEPSSSTSPSPSAMV